MPSSPQGLKRLAEAVRLLEGYPAVAIGGISIERVAGVLATGVASVALVSAIVITSYSIHYTKLYEWCAGTVQPCSRPPVVSQRLAPRSAMRPPSGVITSYSIHYTKLYESLVPPAPACALRKASDLVQPSNASRDSQIVCEANKV